MSNKEQVIEYSAFIYEEWELYVAKTKKGLCYVGSPGRPYEELDAWARKHFPAAKLRESKEGLESFVGELIDYFKGTRQFFSLPVDMKGTLFQEQVWEVLKTIPYGKTCSYSDIAKMVQKPAAIRAVGTAIGANPVLIAVPCHRVISKNGSLGGYRGSLELKRYLLELEKQTKLKSRLI